MDLEKLRRFCDDFYMKMVYNIYWGAVWEGDYYLLNFPRFGGGGQRLVVSSVAASLSLCRHGGKSHGGVVTSE